MPTRQRVNHHHLGHQHQDYNLLFRNQDHGSRNDHKSLDDYRHHQQDKRRRLKHHCAPRQRIGCVLPKCRFLRTPC
jgi:hypothetical protein